MQTLYLGTDPSHFKSVGSLVHWPLIQIIPCHTTDVEQAFSEMKLYTHLIFTSKNAVRIFFDRYKEPLTNKIIAAVGQVTAHHLLKLGYKPEHIADEETQEGLVEILKRQDLKKSYFFLPRSSRSRPVLIDFFEKYQIHYRAVNLYDIKFIKPKQLLNLDEFDQIVFTSPSTVEAFFQLYSSIPPHIKQTAIGPITQSALSKMAIHRYDLLS